MSARQTLSWGRGHVRHGRIPEWLLDAEVGDRAIRLYAILGTYADADGHAFPGKRLILQRLRCSEASYRRVVAELEQVGALTRTPRHRDDGSQSSNDYLLHWSAPVASPESGEGVTDDAGGASPETGLTRVGSSSEDLGRAGDLEPPTLRVAGDEKPPKLAKVDGRDLAFDALAELCGVDPKGNRAREVAFALNGSKRAGLEHGIRELHYRDELEQGFEFKPGREPDPSFEHRLVRAIERRAAVYRQAMPGAALTPLALAKWWTDVEDSAVSRDPAAAAFAEARRLSEMGR